MFNRDLQNKIYSYAINRLGLREYRRGWLKGTCPDCGRDDKFGLNIGQNRCNCFRCGYHPSPLSLITELEGFNNYYETKVFLKAYDGKQYLAPIIERVERIETVLPESYKLLTLGNGLIGRSARKYVKSRGFDPDDMSLKGWGYCSNGDYMGYIIIPFYVMGKLIYFNGRKFMGSGSKYKNPTIEDFGIGKSLIMYNLDALSMYEEVYVAEGAINAETIGDQGVAMGGKKISHYQISLLMRSPVKRFTLLLDPDALSESIQTALELSNHKEVRVVQLPKDNDINDLGKEATMDIIDRTPFMDYKTLLKLKHETRA